MRILEALIIVVTGQLSLAVLVMGPRRPRWSNLLPFLSAALVPAHLALEGGRWQMAPAYLAAAGLCAFGLMRFLRPAREPGPREVAVARAAAAAGLLLVVASATACILFPAGV